ncbi:hypothetical protein [Nocardia cyriacigeorgica]|uniref:hypothetical protein n=1 Tax=Nocardia cyriacigeorgica TaxID=135487 RepID=UPI0024546757|nr:hypothetical protein [Nocardia cyriacigeorgica]
MSGTALMFGSRDEAIDYARQHFTTTFSEPVRESFAWIRGSVTPVNARLDATVGRPIELVVDSDTEEELHVHATPGRAPR